MKKLKILTLAFLLVVHSFLGVTPIAFAEEDDRDVEEIQEVELDGIIVEEAEANSNTIDEKSTDGERTESAEVTIDQNNNAIVESIDDVITLLGGIVPFGDNAPVAEITEAKVTFDKLIVNGTTITNPNEAQSIEPKLGDIVSVYYNFGFEATQDYGVGSTFTLELPPALLDFDQKSLSGSFEYNDLKFSFITVGKTVTVELKEGTIFDGNPIEGTLQFNAKFSEDGANGGLEQELEIPIKGSQSLIFPFVFQPKSTEKSMSKKGEATIEGNDRYINWEVWTNRKGANLQNATLSDNLGGQYHGLELDGNISVEKYVVGLTGVADTPTNTTTVTNFPVELDNGRYAYKLTYKTKVTRVQQNETEEFTNDAMLTNGSETDSATASVTHTYGTKLAKSVTDRNKYNAKWKIQYNYFGSKMDNQTLTDTVTGPHKIKEDTIKVYHVAVDATGTGTKGSEVSNPQITPAADSKSFTVNLSSPNGEAYLIEYETAFDGEYVTTGSSVSNTASYDNGKITANDLFTISEGIFSKSRGDVDYVNKEITWRIHVNAEQAMSNFVIDDTFKTYSEGGTRQKLVNPQNPFTISNGVNATSTTLKGTDGDAGFTIDFGNLTKETDFTITYKTKFNILENGKAYTEYENTAVANWISPSDNTKTYSLTKSAKFIPTESTSNNGYKNGSFDHVSQVFKWKLAVNINKQNINDATLVDTIGAGHELVPKSIKIHQLNLGTNDQVGTPGTELTSGYELTENGDKKGFTIKFNDLITEQNHQAYIVTYETKDSDVIIGQTDGSGSYGNTATFTPLNSEPFTLPASATIRHANELIAKKAETNPDDETITWTIDVNKSHSTLGEITLTDKMSDNQLILTDTFQMREIIMNATGTISYGGWQSVIPTVNSANNSFTLDLGNLNKKGYQIEYKTFFLGGDGDTFSNEASLNYTGATVGTSKEANQSNIPFNFNASSGTVSSTQGQLQLNKIGVNPLTGEQVSLADITFELWNKNGNIKLYEATTDEQGKATFANIRYGLYKLKEVNTPEGYKQLPTGGISVTMNDLNNFIVNGNKPFVVENMKDVDMNNACPQFTLTIKDVDGNQRTDNFNLKLIGNGMEKEITSTAGKVNLQRTDFPAGPYEVYELGTDQDGNHTQTKLGEVVVEYESCKGEIQPTPTCENYTITVQDENNKVRSNIKVTVKDQNGDVIKNGTGEIFTTDQNGKVTVPSSNLPAGKYKLYEGDVYLGEVDVSYKNNCETILTISDPACENCTIIIQDRSGKPRVDVDITVKDMDGHEVIGKDVAGNDTTTFTTDADGKVTFPNSEIKAGMKYSVYEGTKLLGKFTITDECTVTIKPSSGGGGWTPPPTECDAFTVTVTKEGAVVEEGTELTFKSGTREVTGTTDANGNIIFAKNDLPEGTYVVYDKDGNEVGAVDVTYEVNKCQAAVNVPIIDPEDPEQPGDPDGEDQEDPTDPEKPGGEDPEEPSTPGTDDTDDSNHLGGSTNDKDGDKTGTNDTQKGDKQPNDNGQALPQTGEARNINLLVGGVVSILIGLSLILFRRKPETV